MTHLPAIALTLDAQGRPTCLSRDVALHFQRKHKNVLREIDRILAVSSPANRLNFEPVDYTDTKGELRRAYRLTRAAFSILVMGFTGPAAIRWKWRYIDAFEVMEAALRAGADSEALARARLDAAVRLAGSRAALADAALTLLAEGCTQAEAGACLGVSRHVVYRLKRRFGFLAAPAVLPGLEVRHA